MNDWTLHRFSLLDGEEPRHAEMYSAIEGDDDSVQDVELPEPLGDQPAVDDLVVADAARASVRIVSSVDSMPWWAELLGDLDVELDDQLLESGTRPSAAVVFAIQDQSGTWRHFAASFGVVGRHLLTLDRRDPMWGLKTALNMIYAQHDPDAPAGPLRQATSTRPRANTIRTSRQVAGDAAFEEFGVRPETDRLRGVTGRPADVFWGRRVTGNRASLTLPFRGDWPQIGQWLLAIDDLANATHYEESFSWIDHLREVTDEATLAVVRNEIVAQLQALADDPDADIDLDLGPPEIIAWEEAHGFVVTPGSHQATLPSIEMYAAWFRDSGEAVTWEVVSRDSHRLRVYNDHDDQIKSWGVRNCFFGELVVGGVTYVLDEGAVLQPAQELLDRVNDDVDAMQTAVPAITLPVLDPNEHEPDYLKRVGPQLGSVVMDRELIRPNASTSSIEVCDLFGLDQHHHGWMAHVKRGRVSSKLSHLVAQVHVSALALALDADIAALAQEKADAVGGPGAGSPFAPPFRAADWTLVVAIAAAWSGGAPSTELPFFTKLNLSELVRQLRPYGYAVELQLVHQP